MNLQRRAVLNGLVVAFKPFSKLRRPEQAKLAQKRRLGISPIVQESIAPTRWDSVLPICWVRQLVAEVGLQLVAERQCKRILKVWTGRRRPRHRLQVSRCVQFTNGEEKSPRIVQHRPTA